MQRAWNNDPDERPDFQEKVRRAGAFDPRPKIISCCSCPVGFKGNLPLLEIGFLSSMGLRQIEVVLLAGAKASFWDLGCACSSPWSFPRLEKKFGRRLSKGSQLQKGSLAFPEGGKRCISWTSWTSRALAPKNGHCLDRSRGKWSELGPKVWDPNLFGFGVCQWLLLGSFATQSGVSWFEYWLVWGMGCRGEFKGWFKRQTMAKGSC